LNICDFNPTIADAYLNTVLQTIQLAKEIKAPFINMHMADGVYFTLSDKKVYLFEQYIEKYLDSLCRFRNACDKAIGGSYIAIGMENTGAHDGFQHKCSYILQITSRFKAYIR
jgi:hypothetical protein